MGNFGYERSTTKKAAVSPEIKDIHWAAGFLEGEGSFCKGTPHKTNSYHGTQRVQCRQNEIEPLLKLLSFFGGTIRKVSSKSNKFASVPYIQEWTVSGSRARGVMMTLYSLLSPRRRNQITVALS